MPVIIKSILGFITRNIFNDPKASALIQAAKSCSTGNYWKLQYERKKYRQLWIQTWQQEQYNFDILITPAHLLPAVKHDSYKNISWACVYLNHTYIEYNV